MLQRLSNIVSPFSSIVHPCMRPQNTARKDNLLSLVPSIFQKHRQTPFKSIRFLSCRYIML